MSETAPAHEELPAGPQTHSNRADARRFERVVFTVIVVAAGCTIGLDYFVHTDPHFHPHFEVEETFGFYGGWAALAVVGLLVFGKAWSWLVRRVPGYYEADRRGQESRPTAK